MCQDPTGDFSWFGPTQFTLSTLSDDDVTMAIHTREPDALSTFLLATVSVVGTVRG